MWTERHGARAPLAALTGDIDVEIAIVGGGLVGAATALHLVRAGRDVALIDDGAALPASATAASAGIVAPQLVRNTPAGVLRRLGAERGAALLGSVAESGSYTFDLIRDEKLDCAAQPGGFLAPFVAPNQARSVRDTIAGWRPFRADLDLLDAAETARLSGCRGYAGALLDRSGGALDPLAYRNALLARAGDYGLQGWRARVVAPVERDGDRHVLRCAAGRVRARRVILAANGGNPHLWPKLRRTVLPLPVCEVATVPLPRDLAAAILPGGQALTDLQTDIFTIRFDAEGRLITALPAPDVLDRGALEQAVNARLAAALPNWRFTPLDHVWIGTAWLNSDLLPRLVRCDDGVIALQTCNGRGVALAAIAGREAARWAENPGCRPTLPIASPRPIRGYAIARHAPRLIMAAAAALRRIAGRSANPVVNEVRK